MPRLRAMALCLAASGLLLANGEDIYQRLERALADSGQGEAAVAELKAKNFGRVEDRLANLRPANDDQRAELLALSGAVAFLDGKMAQAAGAFHASEKIRPAKEGDRFTLAMALVKLDDDGEARTVLTGLAHERPASAIYWYWLGRLDYDQRRYAEAVENLRQALAREPTSARAWDSLGLAWDMQGQMEEARKAFAKAVSLNREEPRPSAWPPHNFGYLLLRLGETAAAEEALRESLRYDAKLPRTHYYLARVLEKEDRNDEAIENYQIAVAGDRASADACYSLAMLYRKLKRENEANSMFAEFRKRRASDVAPSLVK
jgi:tetratricopeptide (TPR) repeat protein